MVDDREFFIHNPNMDHSPYYGRKMGHSVKAQRIAFIEKRFLNVVAGQYGTIHNTPIMLIVTSGGDIHFMDTGEFLFGDVAYP